MPLGSPGVFLERSGLDLGASCGGLGSMLERSCGLLVRSWERLGPLLGASGRPLGASLPDLEATKTVLEDVKNSDFNIDFGLHRQTCWDQSSESK